MQVEERENKEKHVYRKKKVKASKAGKEGGRQLKQRDSSGEWTCTKKGETSKGDRWREKES